MPQHGAGKPQPPSAKLEHRDGLLRQVVGEPAEGRLRPGTLRPQLRREHILGPRARVDGHPGGGGVGGGKGVLRLRYEYVHVGQGLHALHADGVEDHNQRRVRENQVFE